MKSCKIKVSNTDRSFSSYFLGASPAEGGGGGYFTNCVLTRLKYNYIGGKIINCSLSN